MATSRASHEGRESIDSSERSQETHSEGSPESDSELDIIECQTRISLSDRFLRVFRVLHRSQNLQPVQAEINQEMDHLLMNCQRLEVECEDLRQELHYTREWAQERCEMDGKNERMRQDLQQQLGAARFEMHHLRQNEEKLREIVLKNTSEKRVSDGDMVSAFSSLRQQIQVLACSRTYQLDLSVEDSVDASSSKKQIHSWLMAKDGIADRRLRLRSKIFQVLHGYILDKGYFGLAGADYEDGTKIRSTKNIEKGLCRFENLMQLKDVPEEILTNWRLSALEAIEMAAIPVDLASELSMHMYEDLAPLISKDASSSAQDKLRKGFLKLFTEACQFRMAMRKSREGYACEMVVKGCSLAAVEDLADACAVENAGNNVAGDRVAFTLFGALTKHPKYRGEGKCILEKAQVVVEGIPKDRKPVEEERNSS